MNAATRAVIERLIEASIDSAFKWSATEEESAKLESAIAEARKLLEDAALSKPASEDAWLRKSLRLTANIRDATDDESSAAYFDQLEHHLRARPAREGFVSVPVEWTSMRGLSITSSVEDGTWLRFDLPGGASAAISVLQLAEKFNEKSIVSQVLKEWSAMIASKRGRMRWSGSCLSHYKQTPMRKSCARYAKKSKSIAP